MSALLASRRRLVNRFGRAMTLRRTAQADLALKGALTVYRPEQVQPQGAIRQGDALVALTNDEIAAAGWPAPIRSQDQLVIDGRTWAIVGAAPVYAGPDLAGWQLWVRGGQT